MGFTKLTQETWNIEMAKYKGSCPSSYNSDYEERSINLFRGYDEEENISIIKNDILYMMECILSSPYFEDMRIIETIEHDIDEVCKLGFVDIILTPDTSEDSFKSFLKWLNNNF